MKALNFLTAVLCLSASAAIAQQTPDPNFYKLDFVVKEVEAGKTINSRTYSAIQGASGKERSMIRTGNRVPVPTSSQGGSFQYIDIGVSIDFNELRELPGDRMAIWVSLDISTNAPSETAGLPPIIRQNKWQSIVMFPVRKATMIFASDDPTSKRQIQIEMTATPLK